MKKLIYPIFGVIILLSAQACKDKPAKNYNQETKVDQDGMNFLKNGMEGGLTEIKASGLALTQSNNQRIIGLAKMMIDDHTKAGNDFKKIEKDKLVPETDSLNTDHTEKIKALSAKTGAAFDKAYIQMMIADHTDAIKLFTNASQNTDIEVRNFAAKTLPTLKMHLDSATAINSSLK